MSESHKNAAKSAADQEEAAVVKVESPGHGLLFWLRRLTSVVLGLLVITSIIVIIFVRTRAEVVGFDIANVATFLLTMLALLSLVPLILMRTRWPLFRRLIAVTAVVLVMCAPFLMFRVVGFTGRLVPIVRWRWAEAATLLEEVPAVTTRGGADLATSTSVDFPEFLGPNRRMDLPGLQLDHDWETHPPQLLWRKPIGAGWSGFSVVNGFAVTIEQRGDSEVVTCYAAETGELIWAHSYPARHETVMGGLGPRSTPTIADGRVYTLGATGVLRCLDGVNGELLWGDNLQERCGVTPELELSAVSWGRAASPLVVEDLLIVPLGGPLQGPHLSLIAYDKQTGEVRWTGGDQQISYASPSFVTLCDLEQVLIVNESSVSGHRLEDGSVLWSHPFPGRSNAEANCSQAVVVGRDEVLLTNRYQAEMIRLQRTEGDAFDVSLQWEGRGKFKTKFTNALVRGAHAFALSDGLLECLALEDGQRCWKNRRGNYGHGQLLGVGDVILVQAESGQVVMVEANTEELVELGRIDALAERTWNTPCLYGSLLLVRNDSEAACYRLALREP